MMDADPGPMAGHPDDEQTHLHQLICSLRAVSAGQTILSDSGPHGDQLEDLHAVLGERPCIDAAVTGSRSGR